MNERGTTLSIAAFCGQCGASLFAASQFCPGCGAPASIHGSAATPPMNHAAQSGVSSSMACPRCGQLDASRKLSAVVSDATTQSAIKVTLSSVEHQFGPAGGPTITGGVLRGTTVSQTHLASVLSPPARPVERNAWGGGTGCALFALAAVVFVVTVPMRMPNADIGVIIISIVFAAPFVALAAWLARSRIARQRAYHAAYTRDAPLWEAAMRNWDSLYYCSRCDGVYYPGTAAIYRTTRVMDVIYSHS